MISNSGHSNADIRRNIVDIHDIELSAFNMKTPVADPKNLKYQKSITKSSQSSVVVQPIIAIQPSPLKIDAFKQAQFKPIGGAHSRENYDLESQSESTDSDDYFNEKLIHADHNDDSKSYASMRLLPRASRSDILQYVAEAADFHLRSIGGRSNGELQVVDSDGYPLLDVWPDVDLCRKVWRLETRGKPVLNARESLELCCSNQRRSTVYDWRGDFFGAIVPGDRVWQIISVGRKVVARILPCVETMGPGWMPFQYTQSSYRDKHVEKNEAKLSFHESSSCKRLKAENPLPLGPTSFCHLTNDRSQRPGDAVYCIDAELSPTAHKMNHKSDEVINSRSQCDELNTSGSIDSAKIFTSGRLKDSSSIESPSLNRFENNNNNSLQRPINRWICIMNENENHQIAIFDNKTYLKFTDRISLNLKLLIILSFVRLAGQNAFAGDLFDIIKYSFMCCSNTD